MLLRGRWRFSNLSNIKITVKFFFTCTRASPPVKDSVRVYPSPSFRLLYTCRLWTNCQNLEATTPGINQNKPKISTKCAGRDLKGLVRGRGVCYHHTTGVNSYRTLRPKKILEQSIFLVFLLLLFCSSKIILKKTIRQQVDP